MRHPVAMKVHKAKGEGRHSQLSFMLRYYIN